MLIKLDSTIKGIALQHIDHAMCLNLTYPHYNFDLLRNVDFYVIRNNKKIKFVSVAKASMPSFAVFKS
ncbi:hypothetical protein HI914_06428 [Erysiphe necator]|nr:hypothetical protein HI914_06428 [Erysiphe necator]